MYVFVVVTPFLLVVNCIFVVDLPLSSTHSRPPTSPPPPPTVGAPSVAPPPRTDARKFLELALAVKHQRTEFVFLLHQRTVLESLYHGHLSLNSGVLDCAEFLAVEVLPGLGAVLAEEGSNVAALDKVDERIPSIAFVFEVNWQVEEINLVAVTSSSNFVQEHSLGVLVWDVADHQRGPRVLTALDVFYEEHERRVLGGAVVSLVPIIVGVVGVAGVVVIVVVVDLLGRVLGRACVVLLGCLVAAVGVHVLRRAKRVCAHF